MTTASAAVPQSTEPTVVDALKAIQGKLANLSGGAALDHYPSLRVKTRILNGCLDQCSKRVSESCKQLKEILGSDSKVRTDACAATDPLYYYRQIVPQMWSNFDAVVGKLLADTQPAPVIPFGERTRSEGNFEEFSDLTTSVRQFIENLIIDSFQFVVLDPRELTYQILKSLLSFVIVAPNCLKLPIFSDDLHNVVQAFANLSGKKRRNSAFTRTRYATFTDKAEFLGAELKPSYHNNVTGNLVTVFNFCSEFAHVGYVSTLVTAHSRSEIYMGGPTDTFVPREENLAKLKQQLLCECVIFYADFYVPALRRFVDAFVTDKAKEDLIAELDAIRGVLTKAADETNIVGRIQPVVSGLIGSTQVISFDCSCGGRIDWKPPHHQWDNYCENCGARFEMTEVSPLACYAISSEGVGEVVGSVACSIDQLSPERRKKLKGIWELNKNRLKREERAMEFLYVGNIDAVDEAGNNPPGQLLRVPPKGLWDIGAMVSGTAVELREKIDVVCNCGTVVVFKKPFVDELLRCPQCNARIGIFVVAGDPGYFVGQDPGGPRKLFPVFGSIYKPVKELTPAEYDAVMKSLGA